MGEKKLTIYFTSDLHGYIYPTDYRGQGEKELGLFKCASLFRKDGNTLVIDGGDILQGSPLGAFCHDTIGSAARFAEMMNRCGYDYVTLGNHDFNNGYGALESYLTRLNAQCLCANVTDRTGGLPLLPYAVRTESRRETHKTASINSRRSRRAKPLTDFFTAKLAYTAACRGLSARPLHPFGPPRCIATKSLRLRARGSFPRGKPLAHRSPLMEKFVSPIPFSPKEVFPP